MRTNRFHIHYLTGWLLLAIFTVPFIVKSIHVETTHCELHCGCGQTQDESNSHDEENCPICHFTVSFFTEPVTIHIPQVSYILSTISVHFTEEDYTSYTYPHYQRGPPAFV